MIDLANLEVWFVTGSQHQHLYGPEALRNVEQHSAAIAGALSASTQMPVKIVCKPVMTSSDSIHQLCLDANGSKNCVGLITWMHTFSPARMWIAKAFGC
jgi:L-arabinose isomerase